MKKSKFKIQNLILLLVGFLHFSFSTLNCQSADVVFNLRDLGSTAVANRKVLISPSWMNPSNAIGVLDKGMYRSSASGTFTITNLVEGIYDCEIQFPPARTPFTILVPATNATLYAHQLRITSTNATGSPNTYAWSAAASDARYALLNSLHRGTNFNFTFVASIPLVSYALVTGAGNSELNGRYYLDTNYPGGKTYVSEFDSEFLLHQTDTNGFIWTCESGDVSWYSSVSSATIPAAGLYNNVTPGFSVTPPGPTVSIVYTNSPATNVCTLNFTNGLLWRVSAP